MNLIKQAAQNAGLKIIDYELKFSPPLERSYSKIEFAIMHHDVWPGGTMEKIHVDHLVHQKYRGTSYHGRFPTAGGIELGRPHGMIGGHCKQDKMNYKATGWVFEGNLDITVMSDQQFEDSTKFFAEYIKLTDITIDQMFGHREFANKSCPGKNFPMKRFKVRIQELLDNNINKPAPWAISAQELVMSKMYIDKSISDGKRPFDICTRQEQWVMIERMYGVIMNEVKEMMEVSR